MSRSPGHSFRVFSSTPIDAKDEFEEKLESCYNNITSLLSNASSERERHDILTSHISKGNAEHEDICLGLFAVALVDRNVCQKATQDLMMVNRDSLNVVLCRMNMLILEKFTKLEDSARGQILWFINELVKTNVQGTDGLCICLMKQIIGGDTSPKNVWLAENILDILTLHRPWLDKLPVLIQSAVYTYLRVIQDHFHASLASVRQKEVTFCVSMLRDHWNECRAIGRDLVRMLMGVARIPEFERLWSDLLYKPHILSPNFTGLASLVQMRTSRKFLVSRLTPDMETKITFLLLKVKFGQQKRYQEWFQRQYLSTPESQLLRSDLIRYICGCVHPSNDILCSDIIPRWAVIGWLLSTCTSRIASSFSYLAMFWDWFFYSPDKNTVMDIEAGILVMYNSLRNHPAITTTLLDFLCRMVKNFHPPMTDLVRGGVTTALKTILEKRVLQTLAPVFENPKFDPELINIIRVTFPEFCSVPPDKKGLAPPLPPEGAPMPPPPPNDDIIGEEPMIIEDEAEDDKGGDEAEIVDDDTESSGHDNTAIFSDDEESEANKRAEVNFFSWRDSPEREQRDITEDIDKLDETLKDLVGQIQNSTQSDVEEKCERVEDIVDHLLSLDEFDSDICSPLAACLVELFSGSFVRNILNEELSEEYLTGCVEQPLYVVFRKLCQGREEDDSFSVLLSLLAEMYALQPRLGYHLLFYLAVPNPGMKENNWMVYESFAQSTQLAETYNCLMMDMKRCQEDDIYMVIYLVPHVFRNFPEHCIGNAELMNIITAVLDSQQLHQLQCLVMSGQLTMMKKDSVLGVLQKSLEWETFEQYSTWQLFLVHEITADAAIPLIPGLQRRKHPEALSMFLLLLKNKKPTSVMVRHIVSRPCEENDNFALSLLRHWVILHENEMTEHLSSLLNKSKPKNTPPRKGLRQSVRSLQTGLTQPAQPTTLQLLGHLEELRKSKLPKNCTFFTQDPIIASLMNVQIHCDDNDKSKFSELFALVEESDDEAVVKDLKPSRKRTKSSAMSRSNTVGMSRLRPMSSTSKNESESGSDSSSDEERRRRKKRPKVSLKGNDSSDSD